MGQRYPRLEDEKPGTGLACNLDFAEGKGLEPKFQSFLNWETW